MSHGILSDGKRRYLKFHDLMPFRVHEILLISSAYDAFILEEDGRLSDKLLEEYLELHLSSPPRITRANNGKLALRLLKKRAFDLVIVMERIADMSPQNLAKIIEM